MSFLRFFAAFLSRWIDDAAAGFSRLRSFFRRRRRVRLEEQEDGAFLLKAVRRGAPGKPVGRPLRIEGGKFVQRPTRRAQALLEGGEVELALRPQRFLFRPLDLPRRAGEFLDGVVRAQIDRLTPWSASEAVFGWSAPTSIGSDRIQIVVAAAPKPTIAPLVRALAERRPESVFISTVDASAGLSPIPIPVERSGAQAREGKARLTLAFALGAAFVAAFAAGIASIVYGDNLDGRLRDVQHRIALRRAELISGRASPNEEALAALEARKRSTPSSVIVLEALSQTLPDDTYLTDLHIENGDVEIGGLTRDAPALIKLIEQSQHFTRATFFAPTTRSPTDSGERFHIEAHIEPVFLAQP